MKKEIGKNKLTKIILILYTLSIVLDLHIFYNSISTLIRIGIISILFAIIFIKYSTKKERKLFYIYFACLTVYIILHSINCINFDSHFHILGELLYFYKMIMNIFIFYIVYKLNVTTTSFAKYMKIILWFICGSILVCNIFKIGYSSYDFNEIKGNIFDWFNDNNYNFNNISGKGYFHLANQIVAIILLYLPLLINEIKEKIKISDIILLIVGLLSMLIIGNRLSSAGPLIILIIAFIFYLFLVTLKKEKINFKYIVLLLSTIIIYNVFLYNSPLLKREEYYDNLQGSNYSNRINYVENNEIQESVNMTELFNSKKLNLNFPLKYYLYENDQEFWDNLLASNSDLSDSRMVEEAIIKRIKSLNHNKYDDYLGIGYYRVINVFNIEKDYVMQYYSIGIIGSILLLGIYIILWFKSFIKIAVNLDAKFNYLNILLLLGTGIFLLGAYYSGNILNAISCIIPISFVLGLLVNETCKKDNISNNILAFKVTDLSSEELIKRLKDDVVNNKQNIIYNINPLIITNFYKNEKIVKQFNLQNYNIPDGIGTVIASKMKDGNISKRITGIDMFELIIKMASKNNLSIYLYGSKEGVASKTQKILEQKDKKIKIVGCSNGYMNQKEVLKEIKNYKPDILFVALGSPKQEEFIINNQKQLKNIKIIMPIGGTMDVISGNIKRAPEIYSKLHLEWFYRLIKEPKRIRQDINLVKFVFLVIFRNNWYNKRS